MKRCVKKVYCPDCQRLVPCREEAVNGDIQVLCTRCGRAISLWNGVNWRKASKQQ